MARYRGPKCRLCRREGVKLFLKGPRCLNDKCGFARRSYSPGQHGAGRSRLSDYALRLREKQKVKRIYGILERQFKNYFKRAERARGVTGEILLQFLERRLDNVVFRIGFTLTRNQARQRVKHGHIWVNGKRVDIPSYLVKKDDLIQFKAKGSLLKEAKEIVKQVKERGCPAWIKPDVNNLKAEIVRLPEREDVQFPIQEQLIVELYSG